MSMAEVRSVLSSPVLNEKPMPVLFVGHGSPMNGIEDNDFSRRWEELGRELPKPAAVLCVSAHWYIRSTAVTAMERPRTIHDFWGFPEELSAVRYPAPGSPAVAGEISQLLRKARVALDREWGLDHGCWTVVRRMYPDADIPVLELSLDSTKGPEWHYDLARELAPLRNRGVLVIGSGNMVHNLGMLDWEHQDGGFDWALEMDASFKRLISSDDHAQLTRYRELTKAASLAVPTPEHYLPLLYTLALKTPSDNLSFFNEQVVLGSISMTSLQISPP
jgi:4,5-DOPA dioxygenase extradiol